jgi:4-amino-4-deoxy-L-arabinose transferase-like glycosyltransferase
LLFVAVGTLGVLAGIALAGVATHVSYEWLRSVCDRHAVDGSADFLTVSLFRRARLLAGLAAACLALAGTAVIAYARVLGSLAAQGMGRLVADWRRTCRGWRRCYRRRGLWLWLGLLVLLGLACRLPGLVATPPRGDESFTFVHYACHPLFIVLSLYDQPNNHVLHSVLVHASTRVFGSAPWALRLPAFLAGLALIPLTFVWGRRQAGTQVGLLAAAWVAVCTPMVEYATNARGYSLLCLFTMAMFLAARQALAGRNSVAVLAFVASVGLGLYTVPVMAFPLLGCLIWLACVPQKALPWRSRLLRSVGLAAAGCMFAALCYAPLLVASGPRALLGNEYIAPLSVGEWFAGIGALGGQVCQFWFGGRLAVCLLGAALVAAGAWWLGCRRRAALWPLLSLLVSVVVLAAAMRRWPPPRALVFLVPFLAVCGAGGLLALPGRNWRCLVGSILVAGQVHLLFGGALARAAEETGAFPEAGAICDLLAPGLQDNDRIVLQGPSDGPMLYRLYVRRLPNRLLTRSLDEAGRLWILINQHHGQTLASVLAINGIALPAGGSPPREVARYGEAVILGVAAGEYRVLPPGRLRKAPE